LTSSRFSGAESFSLNEGLCVTAGAMLTIATWLNRWTFRNRRTCHAPLLEVAVQARRRFQLVLVKPSHYHDDGYVIRWCRAIIPANSLAAVYGMAADCAER
jgi:hypothetical protein